MRIFIGGSPCSGKSTVAEILAEKYGLYYFKGYEFLDESGCVVCERSTKTMSGGAICFLCERWKHKS